MGARAKSKLGTFDVFDSKSSAPQRQYSYFSCQSYCTSFHQRARESSSIFVIQNGESTCLICGIADDVTNPTTNEILYDAGNLSKNLNYEKLKRRLKMGFSLIRITGLNWPFRMELPT